MNKLHDILQEVIELLPKDEQELITKISSFPPRENETTPGITAFLEDFGKKIESIFSHCTVNLASDNADISEFRHLLKNLSVRMNQPENSLNKNGERSYEWIDIFRRNIRWITDNETK